MSNSPNFKAQPPNQNAALPTRFEMVFARLPNVSFFCQSVIIPGLSTSYAVQYTPFVDAKIPGDKAVYEPLSVTVLMDEDLRAFRESHDWMRAYTFPNDFSEYANMKNLSKVTNTSLNKRPQYSDVMINVYNSNWQRTITYKFKDAFPTSIGQLSYSASDSPDTPMIVDITFDYLLYDIIPANQSVV